jgi:hypothetical protein
MGWFIGGGILYFILIVTLGVLTIRKGHWVIFIIGIFLPFFWLIGALLPSRRRAYSARPRCSRGNRQAAGSPREQLAARVSWDRAAAARTGRARPGLPRRRPRARPGHSARLTARAVS